MNLSDEQFQNAVSLYNGTVSVPFYPALTELEIGRVCSALSSMSRGWWPSFKYLAPKQKKLTMLLCLRPPWACLITELNTVNFFGVCVITACLHLKRGNWLQRFCFLWKGKQKLQQIELRDMAVAGGVFRFKSRWSTQDMRYKYYLGEYHEHGSFRDCSTEQLIGTYPNFYSIPFFILNSNQPIM